MTIEAVDILVRELNALGEPIPGVTVKVLNEDASLVVTQAESDVDGVISLLLPEATYHVRFFKFGVMFSNPQLIVIAQTEDNKFNVYGTVHVAPVSVDPRLCIASGFFRTASGAPHANLDIHFIANFDPVLLEGAGVLSERIAIRTDSRGFAQVPLIRHAIYDVTMEGMENIYRSVSVPDVAATNLPDLLFPGIKGVVFDAAPPLSVAVGAEVEVQATIITTDLRELTELGGDVLWSLSNPLVMSFELRAGSILIRGLAPGSCELRGTRADRTIVRIPDLPIEGLPLVVNVT